MVIVKHIFISLISRVASGITPGNTPNLSYGKCEVKKVLHISENSENVINSILLTTQKTQNRHKKNTSKSVKKNMEKIVLVSFQNSTFNNFCLLFDNVGIQNRPFYSASNLNTSFANMRQRTMLY